MANEDLVYSIYLHLYKKRRVEGEDYLFDKETYNKFISLNGLAVEPTPYHLDMPRLNVVEKGMLVPAIFCCPRECHEALEFSMRGKPLVESPKINYPKACFIYKEDDPRHIYYVAPDQEGIQRNKKKFKKGEVPYMVKTWNEQHGVTKAVQSAMLMGAKVGWNLPESDPKNYDEAGNYLLQRPTVALMR